MNVYTVKELAALWRCSPSAVYDLLTAGKLQGFKIGHAWRITDEARINYEQTWVEKSDYVRPAPSKRKPILTIT